MTSNSESNFEGNEAAEHSRNGKSCFLFSFFINIKGASQMSKNVFPASVTRWLEYFSIFWPL